jgi:hypothetical protein
MGLRRRVNRRKHQELKHLSVSFCHFRRCACLPPASPSIHVADAPRPIPSELDHVLISTLLRRRISTTLTSDLYSSCLLALIYGLQEFWQVLRSVLAPADTDCCNFHPAGLIYNAHRLVIHQTSGSKLWRLRLLDGFEMKVHPERMPQVHSCKKGPQTGLDVLGDRLSDAEINKKQDSGLNVKFREYIPLRHYPDQRIPTGHDEILLSLRGGINFVAELLGHEFVQLVGTDKAGLCGELARRVPARYFQQHKPHVLDQLMLGVVRFFKYHGCRSLQTFRHCNVHAAIVEARRLHIGGLAEAVTKQNIETLFSKYNV